VNFDTILIRLSERSFETADHSVP